MPFVSASKLSRVKQSVFLLYLLIISSFSWLFIVYVFWSKCNFFTQKVASIRAAHYCCCVPFLRAPLAGSLGSFLLKCQPSLNLDLSYIFVVVSATSHIARGTSHHLILMINRQTIQVHVSGLLFSLIFVCLYNLGQNICGLFHVLPQCVFTTSEM